MRNGRKCALIDGLGLNKPLPMKSSSLQDKFQKKQLILPKKEFLRLKTDL